MQKEVVQIIKLATGKKGFTLLELVIVIALAGIIAATVAPAFPRLIDSIIRESTEKKALNFFRGIRAEAISQGQREIVVIDGTEMVFSNDSGDKLKLNGNLDRIELAQKENKIYFYSDGRLSVQEVTFSLESGSDFTLVVDSVTGRIELEDR